MPPCYERGIISTSSTICLHQMGNRDHQYISHSNCCKSGMTKNNHTNHEQRSSHLSLLLEAVLQLASDLSLNAMTHQHVCADRSELFLLECSSCCDEMSTSNVNVKPVTISYFNFILLCAANLFLPYLFYILHRNIDQSLSCSLQNFSQAREIYFSMNIPLASIQIRDGLNARL